MTLNVRPIIAFAMFPFVIEAEQYTLL